MKLTLRWKITLWFAVALLVVMALSYVAVFYVSNSVIQQGVRNDLVQNIEANADEVEFYSTFEEVQLDSVADRYLEYNGGFLEINDDYLAYVNGISCGVYDSSGQLLYGENPIALETANVPFSHREVATVEAQSATWYVFDRALEGDGLGGLWLRGVVSEEQGVAAQSDIVKLSLLIMPLIIIVAILGGFLIARRSLRPIQQITETAKRIGQGQDLTQRIALDGNGDEVHELANTFDTMMDRLQESFESEKQFTSDASHELRTPMAVIMAQCEYTLEEPRSQEEYVEALQTVQRQGGKMSALISDMLEVTRLQRKADSFELTSLDLSSLVEDACTDLAMLQTKGIKLEQDVAPGLFVKGDAGLLQRLLTNLVTNAYRYGVDDGHIWVRLHEGDQSVILQVQDDGIGISEEDLPNVFKRFYQADSARSGAGTGLGLSMVQHIAAIHGAEVGVESEVGKGTLFSVRFPKCA